MHSALRSSALPILVCAMTTSALVFAATGCGSGGSNAPVPGIPVPSTATSAYANRAYSGSVNLANGQIGNLSLSTTASGTVSGTFDVVDPSRKASPKTRVVLSSDLVTGFFNGQTGGINLTGSAIGLPITIVGTLPIPPATSGGNFTVTIDGQTYSSGFSNGGGTGTPTPSPSASASPTPSGSPSPSPSATPSPGVLNQVTLTPEPGTSPNNSVPVVIAGTAIATLKEYSAASPFSRIALELNDGKNNIVNYAYQTAAPLAPGSQTVSIGAALNDPGANASYREGIDFSKYWQGGSIDRTKTEGTIIVEQVDSTTVRLTLKNVLVDTRGTGKAQGKLRLNGTVQNTQPPTYVTQ